MIVLRLLLKKLKLAGDDPTKLSKIWASNKLLVNNVIGNYDERFLSKNNAHNEAIKDLLYKLECEVKDSIEKQNNLTLIEDVSVLIKDRFLTSGALETGTVSLPISNVIADDVGVDNGLDVEAMLQQMQICSTDKAPLTEIINCSEMVAKVLMAGIQQPHLESVVDERSAIGMNTPQMLYEAALLVQHGIIHNEQTDIWHRLRVFNPAAYIEKWIQSLSQVANNKHSLIIVIALPIAILLIPLLIIKAIVWPLNILGGFLAKEPRVKIISQDNTEADIAQTGLSENELHERNVMDSKLKSEIEKNLKIEQIDIIKPETAILDFAITLSDPTSIPVFANKDVDKLKKYISKHETTPEGLKNGIVGLGLLLPENLDYNKLSDLVDELQLLAAQRVTANVEQLHKVIKNRKTTDTQFEASRDNSTRSSDASKENDIPVINPNPKRELDGI